MKKIVFLILLGLLTACENSIDPEIPESSLDIIEAPLEESSDEADDSTNDEIELDNYVGGPTYNYIDGFDELFSDYNLEVASFKSLYKSIVESNVINTYHDFRYVRGQGLTIYFTDGHSMKAVINNGGKVLFDFFYSTEKAGQALGFVPEGIRSEFSRVLVQNIESDIQFETDTIVINSRLLNRTYTTPEIASYITIEYVKGYLMPFQNLEEWDILFEQDNPIISEVAMRSIEDDILESLYAAIVLKTGELSEGERDFIQKNLRDKLVIVDETVGIELLNVGASFEVSYNDFDMPAHSRLDINMASFYDLITPNDPSSFIEVAYKGTGIRYQEKVERPEGCFRDSDCEDELEWILDYPYEVYIFEASFSDGNSIEFNVQDNIPVNDARELSARVAFLYGQIPPIFRAGLLGVVIIDGEGGVAGGPYHRWYTNLDNCGCKPFEGWAQVEELVMHELAHSSLDMGIRRPNNKDRTEYVFSLGLIDKDKWLQSTIDDGVFLNDYGESYPTREDLAEMTLIYYPYRFKNEEFDPAYRDVVESFFPNRIELLNQAFDEYEKMTN